MGKGIDFTDFFFKKKNKVRVNFRNFHTVAHQPPFGRLAQSNWEMLRIPKQWISSYLMSLRKKAMAGHFLMMLPRKQRPFKCFSAFIAIFPWNQSNVLEFTILFSIKVRVSHWGKMRNSLSHQKYSVKSTL